ncbi:Uu.00g066440.m01.CDS01 [Anthostomella pinea]|uniref:Uu.00g066440.m01.CDS01 n=1 Tax=Anthostomella pinea TaxID=933095 RepID=A0AAI8VTZ8_9PEZI|nr:Uu.00g066440.m01.CDS01 [Anthostomella pinea]
MPPKRAAAPRDCVASKTSSTDRPPRSKRWAAVCASANADTNLLGSLRDPDYFDVYTFNDHAGYGGLEIVQTPVSRSQRGSRARLARTVSA